MAQYLLLLYDDPRGWDKISPEDQQKELGKYMEWVSRPYTKGAGRLTPDAGHVVRLQDGAPHATDGPYSETKEMLGGYYLIEAANYEEAVARAKDHPHVHHGTIEVRQLWEM